MTEIKGISVDEWKKKICEEAERLRPQLIQLSHSIHDEPEIGFQEFKSSAKICDFLEKQGFETERGYCDLPTSFKAVKKGTGKGPVVAFLAEYDALRGVGHGCGHNVIATCASGAFASGKNICGNGNCRRSKDHWNSCRRRRCRKGYYAGTGRL